MNALVSSNTLPCAIRFPCLALLLALASALTQSLPAQTLPYHGTATSSSTLWWITQLGSGPAGEFEINNASNTGPALLATTNGSGPALQATAGSGLAADFNGKVKMSGLQMGSSATSGYVLTTDANGNGAWKKLPADSDPRYSAGAGLALSGVTFSIAGGGVTGAMLAVGSVTSSALAAGAVNTAALADGAVTGSKLGWPLSETLPSGSALLSLSNSGAGDGVDGSSSSGIGVYGYSSSFHGVYGISVSSSGVYGASDSGTGVYGTGNDGGDFYGSSFGVFAQGSIAFGAGVYGSASGEYSDGVLGVGNGDATGTGVCGQAGAYGYGVVGGSEYGYGVYGSSPYGVAGGFDGDVTVTGTLTAGAKNFKIDHPLDPANKYLVHSCIESDQMADLYSGNVVLDAAGQAIVELPDWFEALNKDFRYQLTAIGAPGPNLFIAQEIHNNRFQIAGGQPGMEVSWQVTGIRQDAYAKAHPLEVEQDKPQDKKGKFLHPKELGYPESLGEDYAMQQRRQQRRTSAPTPAQGR